MEKGGGGLNVRRSLRDNPVPGQRERTPACLAELIRTRASGCRGMVGLTLQETKETVTWDLGAEKDMTERSSLTASSGASLCSLRRASQPRRNRPAGELNSQLDFGRLHHGYVCTARTWTEERQRQIGWMDEIEARVLHVVK